MVQHSQSTDRTRPPNQRTSRYVARRRLKPTLSSAQGTLQRSCVSTFRASPILRLPARICRRRLTPAARLISPFELQHLCRSYRERLALLSHLTRHLILIPAEVRRLNGPPALPHQPGSGTLARLDRMAASYSPARGKTHRHAPYELRPQPLARRDGNQPRNNDRRASAASGPSHQHGPQDGGNGSPQTSGTTSAPADQAAKSCPRWPPKMAGSGT